jgi:endonuclease/exonuclease/phosphatase family metal-dependent hydrolase
MGKSKSDEEIATMALALRDADIVAIQEVGTAPEGAQAVGRLGATLLKTDRSWEYSISDATTSDGGGSERYAILYKTSRVKRKERPFLDKFFQVPVEREPYLATFSWHGSTFTLASFHAVPKSKHPEQEISYFRYYPEQYPNLNLIFCGDFNTPQSHTVFGPLKQAGYAPALKGQKTTLRQNCTGPDDCLASEYDNFFGPLPKSKLRIVEAGIVPFYKSFPSTQEARKISDHIPVYITLSSVR